MIKHPLIKKEWKSVRWVMLLFVAVFAFYAVVLNNNIYYEKTSHLMRNYRNTVFMGIVYGMGAALLSMVLIGVLILVILLFAHERNIYVGKFISSLPFTRKKQFTIKYSIGVIAYTLPFLLFGIVALSIRINNDSWISRVYKYLPYGDILARQDSIIAFLQWLGIVWLIITATYSFLMMIQTLMGQNIVAGIVGGIIVFVPWFLMFAIPANLELLKVYRMNHMSFIRWSFEFFILAKPQWHQEQIEVTQGLNGTWWYSINSYHYLSLCIIVLMAVIILSTMLGYRFFQQNDVEKNGNIVMYPWVGKILVFGVTACSLLLLPIIVVAFSQIESSALTAVTMAIGGVLGYIMSTKSIELTRRHG